MLDALFVFMLDTLFVFMLDALFVFMLDALFVFMLDTLFVFMLDALFVFMLDALFVFMLYTPILFIHSKIRIGIFIFLKNNFENKFHSSLINPLSCFSRESVNNSVYVNNTNGVHWYLYIFKMDERKTLTKW